ncbi:putative quinol monooxygenase [Ectobacillus ponti]|uniref:Antibiotic biosynthesis monooxygenase n=1 Tax=Ectobacillus ponti TaxID=2961894 RepID=A0AA42BPP9_9BACI|nr:antibiotic biosynthesis monooxygenase [Ectobacillus ponti]
MEIIVTAILKPKEGCREQLLLELQKVQAASQEETGCVQYKLHESEESAFVLYEIWKDDAAFASHMQSAHYQEYRNQIADLIETREVYKLKAIH